MPSPSITLLRTQSDDRLVALARAGHERAFEAIVERYRRPLLRAARRVLPEGRAEDALQQALLAASRALQRGDEVRDLRAWLLADRDHPLDRRAGALRDVGRHLHDGPPLSERVAQLRQRDHLHVAAAGRLVRGDELDVRRRLAQAVEHP